jgi:UDP-N-acetylmuramoylalanine--D-glutamate ligase
MRQVVGKKVIVLGLARSGLAVARLLSQEGARVLGSDLKPMEELGQEAQELQDLGVEIETGGHSDAALAEAEFVVVSPGIPGDVPFLTKAQRASIPIYSELEVASWWAKADLVAVTGSNGKTTATTLLGRMFQRAGRQCLVAGNIGFPLSASVRGVPPEGVIVVEVSSFQLERIETFRPQVGVILNITPDHLDRHKSMEAYVRSKARLLSNQKAVDSAVLNVDDPRTAALQADSPGRVVLYSIEREMQGGVFVKEGRIISQVGEREETVLDVHKMGIPGPHNLSNGLAAVAAAQIMGVDPVACADALVNFKGLEHRLELVEVLSGVKYVNDSKATNVDAVKQALMTFAEPILLIAGGRDKNGDFNQLRDLIGRRVRVLLLLGEAREKMRAAWGGVAETILVRDLEEAVLIARDRAAPGDCVLLSPACASFDMFRDFEHRGQVFKEVVRGLSGEKDRGSSHS